MLGGSHLNGFVPMWKVKERAEAQRAPDEGSTGTGYMSSALQLSTKADGQDCTCPHSVSRRYQFGAWGPTAKGTSVC